VLRGGAVNARSRASARSERSAEALTAPSTALALNRDGRSAVGRTVSVARTQNWQPATKAMSVQSNDVE
jgi:hypothetical protein